MMGSERLLYIFEVTAQDQGVELLPFLRSRIHEGVSGKALKRALDGKCCTVNGRVELFGSYPLAVGDRIECVITSEKKEPLKPIVTLYEDASLLICNKPAGVLSEPSFFPFPPVHRLDKETSGALILAKTKKAENGLIQLFQKREIFKEYLAIVDGIVEETAGKVDNFLDKKFSYEGQTIWGTARTGEGLRAITFWTRLCNGKNAALLECNPVTGRTHQIRVHLSEMGHPILGDFQYGKQFLCPYRPQRHLLHAHQLRFMHPLTGNLVHVVAPLSEDFSAALSHLGLKL